jgi:riboflavin synthase
MFTGLVESTGTVTACSSTPSGGRTLTVRSKIYLEAKAGDSIAHNGCCLTVSNLQDDSATFDLLGETLRATNLGDLKSGDNINLERSLLPTTRMGGHFVTGHVDTTGTIQKIEPQGADILLRIEAPADFLRFVIPKGCLTVDGMSLTVAEVGSTYFDIWIIPHTLAVTNLSQRKPGQRVNLESDLLAKYTAKLLGR